MLTKYFTLVTTTLVASTFTFSARAENANIEELVIFGNSISDTGNTYSLTNNTFPPEPLYYEGKFSDGPVWVDYLSEDLGLNFSNFYDSNSTNVSEGINFSIGGATTGTTTLGDLPGLNFPGVTTQVNDYLNFLDGTAIDEDALVVYWAGENDYVQAFQNEGTLLSPEVPISNISNSLAQLANAGAENVLVTNLINLANTPLGRSFIPPEQLEQLTLLANAHNSALNSAIASLSTAFPETNFVVFDTNSLLENIFDNSTEFGLIDNPIESCLTPNNFPDIAPNVVPCDNPEEYFYYDNQHFTNAVHQLIADGALQTINDNFDASNNPNPIPESANTLALIGLGLGFLTVLKKNKNSIKIATWS